MVLGSFRWSWEVYEVLGNMSNVLKNVSDGLWNLSDVLGNVSELFHLFDLVWKYIYVYIYI